MEQMPVEDLRKLAASLEEISLCPVCHGVLRPVTVLCVNGHLICEVCKKGQTKCPTCRDDFSHVKSPRFIQQVLEVLPHNCKYESCTQLVKSGDDHELYCAFKPTTCRICDWTGPSRNIYSHVIDEHNEVTEFKGDVTIRISNFDPNKYHKIITPFLAYGIFMWWEQIVDTAAAAMKNTIYIVHERKITSSIFFKASFKSSKSAHVNTIQLNTDPNINSREENSFLIPTSVLHNFIDDKKTLKYSEVLVSKTLC